jgi:hypothetical protein
MEVAEATMLQQGRDVVPKVGNGRGYFNGNAIGNSLTPKEPRPFFGPFLKFGQAIVNTIFVQKI